MPKKLSRVQQVGIVGFFVGAFVPLFWGVLAFIFFNAPEGWFSRAFWNAVYFTCPFWTMEGEKALVLMPLLNGFVYAAIAVFIFGLASRYLDGRKRVSAQGEIPRQK